MVTHTLTTRQQAVLAFIRKYGEKRGYPPSVRDIVDGCALSGPSVVAYNLNALERDGYLEIDRKTARSLRLRARPYSGGCPVCGCTGACS